MVWGNKQGNNVASVFSSSLFNNVNVLNFIG